MKVKGVARGVGGDRQEQHGAADHSPGALREGRERRHGNGLGDRDGCDGSATQFAGPVRVRDYCGHTHELSP